MRVVVGSKNPSKLKAVESAFQKVFPDESIDVAGISVPSGVSDQPFGDEESLQGAFNRAEASKQKLGNADYWVGPEGGCTFSGEELEAFAWMVVMNKSKSGKARTSSFVLPNEVAILVRNGMELGHADDQVFNRVGSKSKNGAVGILTHDVIDRAAYYEQAIILALIPFLHPGLY